MNGKLWGILNLIDDGLIFLRDFVKKRIKIKRLHRSKQKSVLLSPKKKEKVMAMMTSDAAIKQILENEGGYQDNAADKGNYNSLHQLVGTNYGISAPLLESYLGKPPMAADSLALTKIQAADIYKAQFWDQYKLYEIQDPATAIHIMDMFVNHGAGGGSGIVQKALDSMGYTNYGGSGWGSMTRAEVNRIHQDGKSAKLNERIVHFRTDFYAGIVDQDPTQSVFLVGWMKRANKFLPGGITGTGGGIAALLLVAGAYYYSNN